MPNYKDQNNQIHFLDSAEDATKYLPQGCVEITDVEAEAIRLATIPVQTQAEILATYTTTIQNRLDDFAKTRNYDGILSACTYATSTAPSFAAEGQYCVTARDATWSAAYVIFAAVESATRPMPTIAEVLSELPVMVWPV